MNKTQLVEKRASIRKQNEKKQQRENLLEEDIDLGRFFELATTN